MTDKTDRTEPPTTQRILTSHGARVALHCSGRTGPPLLLIHSINAAASAAEVEPLRTLYSANRRVFCIDLPGFGESDRSDRPYSPRLMTDAILAAAEEIETLSGQPADALAVSLSCEFLARATVDSPHLFRSVALVSPTGFSGTRAFTDAAGTTRGKPWLHALLRGPGWGAALYRQLTRPKVIRYFLERTWGSKHIDEGLWRADVQMSRYPGAHFAPLFFLSGELFSADIHTVYNAISTPVWASHGQRGDFVDYRQLALFVERGRWRSTVFNTGALPYFEQLTTFAEEYDQILKQT